MPHTHDVDIFEHILDNLDPADLFRPGFLASFRRYLEHMEEQRDAAAQATDEKLHRSVQPVEDDRLLAVLDQRHLIEGRPVKWYNPNTRHGDMTGATRLTYKTGVCVHHTAVKGGFGADRNLVRRYQAIPDRPVFEATPGVAGPIWSDVRRNLTPDEWARAMALAHRYRGDPQRQYNNGVPYHVISGGNSVLYLNLPFDWVTWHGNGSNTNFLGYAWDGNSRVETPDVEDQRVDLKHTIDLAREEGHPIGEITVHAAWTNKKDDPGKVYVQEVIEPVADATGCIIQWDFKSNKKGSRSMREIVAA